jgi:hypothetical protein
VARRLDVLAARARERRDGRPADGGRDCANALEISRRCPGEACLDDVDAESLELLGDLCLLMRLQRYAGRLLPVAQRRIENLDPAGHEHFLLRGAPTRRTCGVARSVCAPIAWRVFV